MEVFKMSKTLVAFFSASGVTEKVAKKLASALSADLHEIIPEKPYSKEDLDWTNENSRSTIEMKKDKSIRPAIANKLENIDQYDTIYIGFPIWWYIAPTIINTFLEQYNLDGKKVIPFATSGGSGIGETNKELEQSCSGAKLLEGKRFPESVSEEELKKWTESLD